MMEIISMEMAEIMIWYIETWLYMIERDLPPHRDICYWKFVEMVWIFGFHEWEDGNTIDGDGLSSKIVKYEYCYQCFRWGPQTSVDYMRSSSISKPTQGKPDQWLWHSLLHLIIQLRMGWFLILMISI